MNKCGAQQQPLGLFIYESPTRHGLESIEHIQTCPSEIQVLAMMDMLIIRPLSGGIGLSYFMHKDGAVGLGALLLPAEGLGL